MKQGLIYEKSNVKGMGCLYYYFGNSSNVEKLGERGLSHYAEHLKCKSFDHLLPKIKSLGISYNAATYDNFVIFYWRGLDENLKLIEPELKSLFEFTPTQEQFESERKIILQEYDDGFSDKDALYLNIERKYFNYYDPIGFRKDIENVTYDKMLEFMERFKNPSSIIRITDMKKKEVKEFYNDIKFVKPVKVKKNPAFEFVKEGTSSFPNSADIFDWLDISGKFTTYDLNLLNALYSSGLDSPLYKEIRENRGLVYGLYLGNKRFRDKTLWYFRCSTNEEKIQEIRDVFMEVMTNPEKYITKDLFDSVYNAQVNAMKIEKLLNYQKIERILFNDGDIEKWMSEITYERVIELANVLKNEITHIKHASYGTDMLF